MTLSTPWIFEPTPISEPAIRIFCVPYAGGSASAYREWSKYVSPRVQLCPIELPGHGSRWNDPLRTEMTGLVADLVESIEPLLDRPYAVFGHSMGSVIALNLASTLEQSSLEWPMHAFVSGFRPLHVPWPQPCLHQLGDADLIERLRSFGGTPESVLGHDELMKVLLPVLRADFQLIETAAPVSLRPLHCSMSVFAGQDDPGATLEEMEQWCSYTRADFRLRSYPGNHFFPWSCLPQLIRDMETDLQLTH
jgi:surfactin synthase thioesterase subunit